MRAALWKPIGENTESTFKNNSKKPLTIRKRIAYCDSMKPKVSKAVREYMASIGRAGGKANGERKARSSEQARAAVMARWNKHKVNKP